MIPKSALGIAAAGAGIAFIGYCVYFDHKRRSDPLFKQKLRERRKKNKEGQQGPLRGPKSNSYEDIQRFFLQEVQVGEELLASGEVDKGIEHLSNAVAVCSQPQQLLQVLQSSLPPQIFQLLLQKIPSAGQRIIIPKSPAAPTPTEPPKIVEDDVE